MGSDNTETQAGLVPAQTATASDLAAKEAQLQPSKQSPVVAIRRLVTYVAADTDAHQPTNDAVLAGENLAALIVRVNDDGTVNLHVFCANAGYTLFRANVQFGEEPGNCHF